MKQSMPETTHPIDAEGHLVKLENETDEEYALRSATVLHQTGNSANHPDLVMSQYDEPDPPPPEMNPEESPPDIEPVIGSPIRG
jgi:hypothetical protein